MARAAAAVAIVLLILAIPAPALAFVPRGGDTVIVSEPIADDLYVSGQTIEIRAPIDGDVVAAGYRITVSAPVSGAVLAAGATIGIESRVGRSVRAVAGRLSVRGTVDTDLVAAGRQVLTWETTQVGRDFVAVGSRVRVLGSVGRNAYLSGGDVIIGGTIAGDVNVTADRLRVHDTARITGKLTYSVTRAAEISSAAQIGGGVERIARPARRRPAQPFTGPRFRLFSAVVEAIWLVVIGFVAVAISARGVFAVADRIRRAFWMSLFGGFVLAVVVPVAAIILCITVLGIPLGLVALLLYALTLYPAVIFSAAWLGERIVPTRRESGQSPPSPYLIMVVGIVAVVVLMAIPIVGWIFRIAAILVGFGALWAKIWAAREAPSATAPPGAPPPPSGGPAIV